MNTLILLEDDKEHTRNTKEGEIKNPEGITSLDHITSNLKFFDHAALKALGDPAAAFGVAYFSFIIRKIIDFGEKALANEDKKPPAQQKDVVPFQIIAEFHQTNQKLAEEITKAFQELPKSKEWQDLPAKHNRELRVYRVWLLSCESAGGRAQNAKLSPKYSKQAADMCDAALLGCIRRLVAPPSNPPQCWYPYVYAFSTGDIVKGSLSLNPNHVTFKLTPDWEVDKDGNIVPTHGGNPDKTDPSGGTVYRYDIAGGSKSPAPCGQKNAVIMTGPMGPAAEIDILNNPFHD
ncbi:MAG TPA: hypothetical protein VGO59_17775 [Verrucomicrobiae bacterium]